MSRSSLVFVCLILGGVAWFFALKPESGNDHHSQTLTSASSLFASKHTQRATGLVLPSALASGEVSESDQRLLDLISEAASQMTEDTRGEAKSNVSFKAKSLSANDIQRISSWLLDPNWPGDQRTVAVYLLSQATPASLGALSNFVRSPLPVFPKQDDPHSAGSLQSRLELSLRISALEAVDNSAADDSVVRPLIEGIIEQQEHASLRFLAQLALSGREAGKPGKLKRFVDQVLRGEKVEE